VPLVKRGDIFHDSQYLYPAGNIEQKYIIVLNKNHLPTQPVVAIPAHTDSSKRSYHPGCNHRSLIFLLKSKEDFFPNDTKLQIFILNNAGFISESEFILKKDKGTIQYCSCLRQETAGRLMKCVKDLKDDVTQYLHQYLF